MKKIKLDSRTKKAVASAALGILLAQGLTMVTTTEAKADGTCAPRVNWVCGLNGQNYDHKYLY